MNRFITKRMSNDNYKKAGRSYQDNLTPDEKSKLISDLAKRSTNPNMPVSNPEILDKIHQTYTSTLAPSTSAAAVSKKEVTVPGGSASAPASYINTSVSTKL